MTENAVSENKATPRNLAYLTVRMVVFADKPQLYGMQFDWGENGEFSPNLLDNLNLVNQLKRSIGLNT